MRIGICGTGDISHEFMEAANLIDAINVTGVYHRQQVKAEQFAHKYEIKEAYDNYLNLVNSCEMVYVALPNSLHFEYAKTAILQGVNVLIEKPICSNASELKELIELSKVHQVKIFEVSRVNTLPHFKKINELLTDEKEDLFINISFCKQSRKYQAYLAGDNPNTFTTQYSGGALYDLGVYGVHFAVGLLGEPTEIDYKARLLDSGADGYGALTLQYPNAIVTIVCSKMTHGNSDFTIQGIHKKIYSKYPVSTINSFEVIEQGNSKIINEQSNENMVYVLQEVIRIVRENDLKAYEKQLNQSLIVTRVLEQARKQAGIIFDIEK